MDRSSYKVWSKALDGGTRRKLFAIAQFDCDTWSACQKPSRGTARMPKASVELLKGVRNSGVKQVISYEGVVPELFARFNGVYAEAREHCGLDSSDGRVVPRLRREKPGGRKE